MAITPNYSWPLPDDTSLVKDGAEAIRDLGNAIDDTVENLPSGGLVHINSTTMTAVASQSINDVFSATFDNYLLVFNSLSNASAHTTSIRFRVDGSDASGANYAQSLNILTNGLSNLRDGTGFTGFQLYDSQTTQNKIVMMYVKDVFLSKITIVDLSGKSGGRQKILGAGEHTLTNSFTGFTAIASAGSVTGSVDVYGLEKS